MKRYFETSYIRFRSESDFSVHTYCFIPLAFETFGSLYSKGIEFITHAVRRNVRNGFSISALTELLKASMPLISMTAFVSSMPTLADS